jgi:hypothetical protein
LIMRAAFTVPMLLVAAFAGAAEIHAPAQITAGNPITIQTSGSGDATFYLIGQTQASKRKVQAGTDIKVDSLELERAGIYAAILCASDGCSSANFAVNPAAPNRLSFLVHPSRVPVDSPNRISAVAVVQDNFHNIVLKPEPVKFSVMPEDGKEVSATRPSENGVAWVPDGTVVSFTKVDSAGKANVDVPIKRGVAKVELPVQGRGKITVASGVVTGNELELGGGQ